MNDSKILILDFGSQYTQLIARRVRELGVYCELLRCDVSPEEIKAFKPCGIILSGGPETVTQTTTPRIPEVVFEMGCPVLGICYGMQAMALQKGGKVESSDNREFGAAQITLLKETVLLRSIQDHVDKKGSPVLDVWMSHGDHVTAVPSGFDIIASSNDVGIVAMANEGARLYGLQFHPEVTHSKQGKRILKRFVLKICHCQQTWTMQEIIKQSIETVRQKVGQERVILGLSGGVDSSVVAALLHQAIGDQLTCVFVDTGLMRLHEAEQVVQTFQDHLGIQLITVNAQQEFFAALDGVSDPEVKRKVVGKLFIDIFAREAAKIQDAKWLAQGTIYPDVIESAAAESSMAHTIKTHHNVGGLPEHLPFKLIEPLRELFKDEVRQLGLELGLPYDMVYRHPFPGPGLAVRILGEVKKEYVDILKAADAIFIEALYQANYYHKVSQAFAVFLPVKSVGVMGDARKYEYVIALRAVETDDFMTAHWARLPYELLETVSNRIVNTVQGVSRVTYDISSKPPATIEWE